MNISVLIEEGTTRDSDSAPISLIKDDGTTLCQLDVQFSKLAGLPQPHPRATDFLLLASAVYSVDKLIFRKHSDDCWTRQCSLTLPVSDVGAWNGVKVQLDKCLSFLTGDEWDVIFTPQTSPPMRPAQTTLGFQPTESAVCLFSGGLDSLIGAIDWLEQNPDQNLLLVGHYDEQMKGPKSDQDHLVAKLGEPYRGRFNRIQVGVGHINRLTSKSEITLRGRSLIFIALGIYVASAVGQDVPMLIPENGTIALNAPLSPSRRGSCSTRTAHPYYLTLLRGVLESLGINNAIINPLESKTKGEAVTECLNLSILEACATMSVSCAKRGHKRNFTRRNAKACGRCMPCIYRRAALHKAGWDDEIYGDDFCVGEVDVSARGEKPNDLRACLGFLKRNVSTSEIAKLLMTNGSLEPANLPTHAAMVQRTMEEIRILLREKATTEIQRIAGV